MSTGNPDGVVQMGHDVAEKVVRFTMEEGAINVGGLVKLICNLTDQLRSANAMVDSQRQAHLKELGDVEAMRAAMQHDLNEARADYDELAKLALPALRIAEAAIGLVTENDVVCRGSLMLNAIRDMIADLVYGGYDQAQPPWEENSEDGGVTPPAG